jgi:acetyl-CoA carboxylase biotin carboxyl carrier protein
VADDPAKTPGPFDVRTIKHLVALMSQHDLSEIDLHQGDQRIRLRRGPVGVPVMPAALPAPAPLAARVPEAPAAPVDDAKPKKHLHEIKSPTPGTFYVAPSPGADPFVRVGSRVTPTTVVGIIEAMKVLNNIDAECSGLIVEVVAENGQPVEFGEVLFRVDTAG